MFFDDVANVKDISSRTSCAVFVIPRDVTISIKNALVLEPEDKSVITIEQVKNLISRLSMKQLDHQYIIIRPAELLGEEAANAFLKNLEEPKEKIHFILVTEEPSRLLPTILSRSQLYFLKQENQFDETIKADKKTKEIAKKLLVAKGKELVSIAEEICAVKDNKREYAMNVVSTAIEMLYKTYFITKKDVFVKKLPQFLELYDNLERNGHIKLHLVANLC